MKKLFIIVLILSGTHLYSMALVESVRKQMHQREFENIKIQYQNFITRCEQVHQWSEDALIQQIKTDALQLARTIKVFRQKAASYTTECNYMEDILAAIAIVGPVGREGLYLARAISYIRCYIFNLTPRDAATFLATGSF